MTFQKLTNKNYLGRLEIVITQVKKFSQRKSLRDRVAINKIPYAPCKMQTSDTGQKRKEKLVHAAVVEWLTQQT